MQRAKSFTFLIFDFYIFQTHFVSFRLFYSFYKLLMKII